MEDLSIAPEGRIKLLACVLLMVQEQKSWRMLFITMSATDNYMLAFNSITLEPCDT